MWKMEVDETELFDYEASTTKYFIIPTHLIALKCVSEYLSERKRFA